MRGVTLLLKIKEIAKIAALLSVVALVGGVLYFMNKQVPMMVEVQLASTREAAMSELAAARVELDDTRSFLSQELSETRGLLQSIETDAKVEIGAIRGLVDSRSKEVIELVDGQLSSVSAAAVGTLDSATRLMNTYDETTKTVVDSNRWLFDCTLLYDARGNPDPGGQTVCASKQAWSRFLGISGSLNKTLGNVYKTSDKLSEASDEFIRLGESIGLSADELTVNSSNFMMEMTALARNSAKLTEPLPKWVRFPLQVGLIGTQIYSNVIGTAAIESIAGNMDRIVKPAEKE